MAFSQSNSNQNQNQTPNNPFNTQSNSNATTNQTFSTSFGASRPPSSNPFALSTSLTNPFHSSHPDPFASRSGATNVSNTDPFASPSQPNITSNDPFVQPPSSSPLDPFRPRSPEHDTNHFKTPDDRFQPSNGRQPDPFVSNSNRHRSEQTDPFAPRSADHGMSDGSRSHSRGIGSSGPFGQDASAPVLGDPFAQQQNPPQFDQPFPSGMHVEAKPNSQDEFYSNEGSHATCPSQTRDPFAATPSREGVAPRTQLFLKSVPPEFFDRNTIIQHFANASFPALHVTNVSLRGGRYDKYSRRTAIISFANEADAARALELNNFQGEKLSLSYFRTATERAADRLGEPSDELLFSFVPQELFSESSIRNLFNSISPNSVVRVGTREKLTPSGMKRTALITFVDVQSATTALENLPLYNNAPLQVSFRQRPQQSTRNPSNTEIVSSTPEEVSALRIPQGPSHVSDPFDRDSRFSSTGPTGDMDMGSEENEDSYSTRNVTRSLDESGQDVGEEIEPQDTSEDTRAEQLQEQAERDQQYAAKKREMENLRRKIKEKEEESRKLRERERKRVIGHQLHLTSKSSQLNYGETWRKGPRINLCDAVAFVGTCQTMCPQSEIDERTVQKEFSIFESRNGSLDPSKAVKKYRRSAALSEQPHPVEVRPPGVLLMTMGHLKQVCDEDSDFAQIHHFIRDRTRSLRQDFTLQGVKDETAIRVHEESVRFHILSEQRLSYLPIEQYSSRQNLEQLDKCLISLREMYDLRREENLPTSPNEPEMQAYYVICHMSDSKKCHQILSGLAPEVRRTKALRTAFEAAVASSLRFGNPVAYFRCMRDAPYLTACLLQIRATEIHGNGFMILNNSYGMLQSPDVIPLATLTERFYFESHEETLAFCRLFQFGTKGNGVSDGSEDISRLQVILPSMPSMSVNKMRTICSKWESRHVNKRIEKKAQGLKPSQIIAGNGGVSWERFSFESRKSHELPHRRTIIRKSVLRRLQLRRESPLPKERFLAANLGQEKMSEVEKQEVPAGVKVLDESVGTSDSRAQNVRRPKETIMSRLGVQGKASLEAGDIISGGGSQQVSKQNQSKFFGSSSDYENQDREEGNSALVSSQPLRLKRALSDDKISSCDGVKEQELATALNEGGKSTMMTSGRAFQNEGNKSPMVEQLRQKKKVRFSKEVVFSTAQKAHSFQPQFKRDVSPISAKDNPSTSNLNDIFKLQVNEKLTSAVGPSEQSQSAAHDTPIFNTPDLFKVLHDPKKNAQNSQGLFMTNATESSGKDPPNSSAAAAVSIDGSVEASNRIEPHATHESASLAQVPSSNTAQIQGAVTRSENNVAEQSIEEHPQPGSLSKIKEFVNELYECVDSVEKSVAEIRSRRYPTEDMYVRTYKQALQSLNTLQGIAKLAKEGQERAFESDCAKNWIDENVTLPTKSMLVPLLRQSSLLWDELELYLSLAEYQQRHVKLRLRRLPRSPEFEGHEGHPYALETARELEKPDIFSEMGVDLSEELIVGTRQQPRRLNELTDVAVQIVEENVRCWQVCLVDFADRDRAASHWVQTRLCGWDHGDESGVVKLLELEPDADDRYVSVVNCGRNLLIPETANAVVATLDLGGGTQDIRRRIQKLEGVLEPLKERSRVVNNAIPMLILVAVEETSGGNYENELRNAVSSFRSRGLASLVRVVVLSVIAARSFGMNAAFLEALLSSVKLVGKWEGQEGLTLCEKNVCSELRKEATRAWKHVLVYTTPYHDLTGKNTEVLEAVNEAWTKVAIGVLAQEVRWPVEIRRRSELSEIRAVIEQNLKLPMPGEVQASNTASYIAYFEKLLDVTGVTIDYEDSSIHPLWQFCLALDNLILPFIKHHLKAWGEKPVLLPLNVRRDVDPALELRVEARYHKLDRRHIGVIKEPEQRSLTRKSPRVKLSDGGERSYDNAIDRAGKRIRLSTPQLSWRPSGGAIPYDGEAGGRWRRMSAAEETSRPSQYSMYDILVHEEEEYSKVIDQTMAELQARALSFFSQQNRRQSL